MHTVWYASGPPGSWLAIARTGRALVVRSDLASAEISRWWDQLDQPSPLQEALEQLVRDGISSAPSFALLEWTADSVHTIVRGGVTVTVEGSDARAISGHGVSTWVEARVAGVTRVDIALDDTDAATAVSLPLMSGAVWVSALAVAALPHAAPSTDAQPEAVIPEAAPAAMTPPARVQVIPPPPPVTVPSGDDIAEATIVDVTSTYQEPPATASGSGYAHLFGETVMRSVEEAAVRATEAVEAAVLPPPPPPPARASSATPDGLHDGQTVLQEEVLALRAARKSGARAAQPAPAPAPRFSLDSGAHSEDLSTPIIIGRAPSVSKVSRDEIPRLVTISGQDQDISRNHVRVAVEGGTVVVTDLESRNGTQITLPGRSQQQLRAGVPTPVLVGTVIDLGGGITYTVSGS